VFNANDRLLKKKKKRTNRLPTDNVSREFDLNKIKNKLQKVLDEENE
jgi:hypothetical protein